MQTLAGAGERGARRPEEAAESTGKTIFKEEPGKRNGSAGDRAGAPYMNGTCCGGKEGPPDHLG